MIREAISDLVAGQSLSMEDAATVMEEIMEGEATPAQLGASPSNPYSSIPQSNSSHL